MKRILLIAIAALIASTAHVANKLSRANPLIGEWCWAKGEARYGAHAIAKGEVEMGLYNVSEIPEGKGLGFAGPVPALLQITTSYEGALMSDGSEPQAARAFIRFAASPEARAKWLAARLEPLADR